MEREIRCTREGAGEKEKERRCRREADCPAKQQYCFSDCQDETGDLEDLKT